MVSVAFQIAALACAWPASADSLTDAISEPKVPARSAGAGVPNARTCPHFIYHDQVEDTHARDVMTLGNGVSAVTTSEPVANQCTIKDRSIQSALESDRSLDPAAIEAAFASDPTYALPGVSPFLAGADCFHSGYHGKGGGPTMSATDRSEAIAYYYYVGNRLKSGETANLEQVASLNSLLVGSSALSFWDGKKNADLGCPKGGWAGTTCEKLKNSCPADLAGFDLYVEEIKEHLAKIQDLNQKLKDAKERISRVQAFSDANGKSRARKDGLFDKPKQIEALIQNEREYLPFLKGDQFKNVVTLLSEAEIRTRLIRQIKTDRDALARRVQTYRKMQSCVQSNFHEDGCDSLDDVLADSPEPFLLNGSGKNKQARVEAQLLLNARCRLVKRAETKKTIRDRAKTGTAVLLGIASLAAPPLFTAIAEASLPTGIATIASAGAVNAMGSALPAYNDLKQKCYDDYRKLVKSRMPQGFEAAQHACSQESALYSPKTVTSLSECMHEAGTQVALAIFPAAATGVGALAKAGRAVNAGVKAEEAAQAARVASEVGEVQTSTRAAIRASVAGRPKSALSAAETTIREANPNEAESVVAHMRKAFPNKAYPDAKTQKIAEDAMVDAHFASADQVGASKPRQQYNRAEKLRKREILRTAKDKDGNRLWSDDEIEKAMTMKIAGRGTRKVSEFEPVDAWTAERQIGDIKGKWGFPAEVKIKLAGQALETRAYVVIQVDKTKVAISFQGADGPQEIFDLTSGEVERMTSTSQAYAKKPLSFVTDKRLLPRPKTVVAENEPVTFTEARSAPAEPATSYEQGMTEYRALVGNGTSRKITVQYFDSKANRMRTATFEWARMSAKGEIEGGLYELDGKLRDSYTDHLALDVGSPDTNVESITYVHDGKSKAIRFKPAREAPKEAPDAFAEESAHPPQVAQANPVDPETAKFITPRAHPPEETFARNFVDQGKTTAVVTYIDEHGTQQEAWGRLFRDTDGHVYLSQSGGNKVRFGEGHAQWVKGRITEAGEIRFTSYGNQTADNLEKLVKSAESLHPGTKVKMSMSERFRNVEAGAVGSFTFDHVKDGQIFMKSPFGEVYPVDTNKIKSFEYEGMMVSDPIRF